MDDKLQSNDEIHHEDRVSDQIQPLQIEIENSKVTSAMRMRIFRKEKQHNKEWRKNRNEK